MKFPQARIRFASVLLFAILSVNFLAAQDLRPGAGRLDKSPDGHVQGQAPTRQPAVIQGNGINYHNGPVLKGNPVPIYVIWYGNWTNGPLASDSAVTVSLVEAFLASTALGGSGYEAINSTYGDTTGNVSGHLGFSSAVFDSSYSSGKKLSDRVLPTVVSHAIAAGLPSDANGVYLILTSSDVSESSGFCRTYCGFHTHATIGGADIKYAFIGNVDKCQNGCEAQTTGPNSPSAGVGGADGMINVITHETEEAITDPDLNAWFDASGNEDADKCNFKFGPTQIAPNGSHFNQTFGGKNWLIQMEWENSRGGGCDQTLGGAFFTN